MADYLSVNLNQYVSIILRKKSVGKLSKPINHVWHVGVPVIQRAAASPFHRPLCLTIFKRKNLFHWDIEEFSDLERNDS